MGAGLLVVAALAGVGVGVLSGMLGIGGGTVMVPIFRLGFGLAAIEATATSLLAIVPTSAAGCVTHLRNKTCVPAMGLAAGLGGALTSPVGVQLAAASPAWAIMLAAAAVIAYSSTTMIRKGLALPKGGAAQAGAGGQATPPAPPAAGAGGPGPQPSPRRRTAIAFAAGLVAGVASGYVGVGGGFIMVPLFITFAGIPMKKASGTSLIAVTILAVPGVVAQMMLGNVAVAPALAMACGAIPGAVAGATLVKRVPERSLRLLFGGFLLAVAVLLAVKEFLL